jgi:hypothetical protein
MRPACAARLKRSAEPATIVAIRRFGKQDVEHHGARSCVRSIRSAIRLRGHGHRRELANRVFIDGDDNRRSGGNGADVTVKMTGGEISSDTVTAIVTALKKKGGPSMRVLAMTRLMLLSAAIIFLAAFAGYGQSVLTLEDLVNMPGKTIAKGSNTTPIGQFGIKSYHIEELTLTAPVLVDGQTINAQKAWRISVTGGPFPVRSQAAVITVGSTDLRTGVETKDLSEVAAITFDDSMLINGATISLSYGDDKNDVPDKLNR